LKAPNFEGKPFTEKELQVIHYFHIHWF
jgi:hypothetical protein